jgi:hypothetical protein
MDSMRSVVWLVALVGCDRLFGAGAPQVQDAKIFNDAADAAPDSPPVLPCFGSSGFKVCLESIPTTGLKLTGPIDTDTSPLCGATGGFGTNQPNSCIIVASMITVMATTTFSASGSRPLVLVASDTIIIDGTLDVASHVSGTTGPASDPSLSCPTTATPVSTAGGAGGSFLSMGGDGGSVGGGNGGKAGGAVAAPVVLRGGCPGQQGGSFGGGNGGHGGGVVYLVAGAQIRIGGTIDASGAGAGGAMNKSQSGGGGAGSGGMIVLWAPAISATGTLIANGGGGGSGDNMMGADGSDPIVPSVPAPGGVRDSLDTFGNGGSGSVLMNSGTSGNGNGGAGGAGGGGGGAGYIRANQPLTGMGAAISPLADIQSP